MTIQELHDHLAAVLAIEGGPTLIDGENEVYAVDGDDTYAVSTVLVDLEARTLELRIKG